MAYQIGKCTMCDCQCMVADTNGRFNSFKPCMRQVDLVYEKGPRIRTILCEECMKAPDFQKIYDELTHEGSQAGEFGIAALKKYGVPQSLTLSNGLQGRRIGV